MQRESLKISNVIKFEKFFRKLHVLRVNRLLFMTTCPKFNNKKYEGAVYMEEGQPSLPRSHLARLFFIEFCFVYMRGASPPRRDLAIQHPRSRLGGLEISHVNAIKRVGPPRQAGRNNRIDIEQWN